MVELPDTRGLICGFQLHENGTSEALNWDLASEPNRSFDEAVRFISASPMSAPKNGSVPPNESLRARGRFCLIPICISGSNESKVALQGFSATCILNSTETPIAST